MLLTSSAIALASTGSTLFGTVTGLTGDPYYIASNGSQVAITSTTQIPVGSEIVTDGTSTVSVSWVSGATTLVAAGSTVGITALATSDSSGNPEVTLNLVSGSVSNHVTTVGSVDFTTTTSSDTVAANGTTWTVNANGTSGATQNIVTQPRPAHGSA